MTPGHVTFSGPLGEASEFASCVRSMAVEALSTHAGPFTGTVSSVDLDGATLEILRSDPVLLLGAAARDRGGFLLVLDAAGEARWNGAPIGMGQVALFGDGKPVAIASRGPLACALVSSTGPEAAGVLPPGWRRSWHDPPDHPVRRVGGRAHARLAALARATARATAIPGRAEAVRARHASLRDAVEGLLAPQEATVPRRRGRAPSRLQIVREADDYLQANPARPVYTDELCADLGVSASCLHGAFEGIFGLSPHRFLKLRRMAMARAMLLSGSGPWHSVKAAALSYGFWHLGQFAHDYRAAFGEAPSETLARAGG
jgi:AraC family transcriptional regulator, ethanolamine operon transcriptional activator